MYDSIVIGCGFAGAVVARKLAEMKGQSVLVLDARDHIGGNCYDREDEHGILIHQYGPHIFHTNIRRVAKGQTLKCLHAPFYCGKIWHVSLQID